METAVVLDRDWRPIYFHAPAGRTDGSLPDSHDLWTVLWQNRGRVLGVAHTHPGHGEPHPSREDVTTFSAVERAFGIRLLWPIATIDTVRVYSWRGPEPVAYAPWGGELTMEMLESWLDELQRLST